MTYFEPLHKLHAHDGYILKCLLSPEFCDPNRYVVLSCPSNSNGLFTQSAVWNKGPERLFSYVLETSYLRDY